MESEMSFNKEEERMFIRLREGNVKFGGAVWEIRGGILGVALLPNLSQHINILLMHPPILCS